MLAVHGPDPGDVVALEPEEPHDVSRAQQPGVVGDAVHQLRKVASGVGDDAQHPRHGGFTALRDGELWVRLI